MLTIEAASVAAHMVGTHNQNLPLNQAHAMIVILSVMMNAVAARY